MIDTCRAKDKDKPTSPGFNASLPSTANMPADKMTRSPINSDHTPIHLKVTDNYTDWMKASSISK